MIVKAGNSRNALTAPAILDLINGARAHGNSGNTVKSNELTLEALKKVGNFLTTAAPIIATTGGSSAATSLYYDAGSGTAFTPNFANGLTQIFTLTGNTTIAATSGGSAGQEIVIVLVQDATGGWQPTWDASYLFPGVFGLDPTPATASVFVFRVNGAGHLFLKCPVLTGVPWP